MKAYGVFPAFDLDDPAEPSVQDCISLITAIVCASLRADGDVFHAAIDWHDPGSEPWSGLATMGVATPNLVLLSDLEKLEALVRMSVDPFSGKCVGGIRSIATCRVSTFGHDGQAFLCLRHEDAPPVSPRPEVAVVEERPEFLTDSDCFDGVIVSPPSADQD
jgi:hypothetical protein